MIFDITKEEILHITSYVSKNIDNIKSLDNTEITLRVVDIISKNKKKNDINIFELGFGNYIYKFEDNDIKITYLQDGQAVGTSFKAEIYERMIVECDKDIFMKFYEEACKKETKKKESKLNILIPNKYGEWNNYSYIPARKLESIFIDDKIKQKIKNDINDFLDNEKEYDEFGIPYKKIYLLTGIPGSGKTSLIKALCNEINYNLAILSLSKEMDNKTLLDSFRNLESKTFLLIEDIDCIFEKRNATKDNPLITFSNLINVLDGVLFKHGLIVFITTNHPENLDAALLRQGRIDMIVKLDYPKKIDIDNLFKALLNKYFTEEQLQEEFVKFYNIISGKNITMSAIVNFLFRYRNKYMEYVHELIDTDSFIKKISGSEHPNKLYL